MRRPRSTRSPARLSGRPASSGIYLGSAAGVGKTCAMLDEGWRRHQRGTDVVVGFVETHGRPHTAELIRDLGWSPAGRSSTGAPTFEEMDLAAVLARRPEVVLVDELAHTNVPGSGPHEKRWEDVLDLLEAGIAVISTVNIQHLESLADAVEQITGVQIRERVPDWVVRKADQIELIDSSADQLRRRMLHGNIYPADQGARRPDRVLQDREPGGPARAGAALRGRRDRRGAARATSRTTSPARSGTRPSGSWSRSPGPRAATAWSAGPPAWPAGPRATCWPST